MASSIYEQDQKTLSQIEAIDNEIKASQLLTSDLRPIATLLDLYTKSSTTQNSANENENENENTNFVDGTKYLAGEYESWRQVRGDGNCYYRAFLYKLCEQLATGNYAGEFDRIQSLVQSSIDEVVKFGYDQFTIETFHEELVDLVNSLSPKQQSSQENADSNNSNPFNLHAVLNEENATSDYCTWYLRLLTSIHLQKDPDRFIHFLPSSCNDGSYYLDVPSFCKKEVEPMGRECEMVQVLALAEYLGVRVHIEYLDGNSLIVSGDEKKKKLTRHEFGPEISDASSSFVVTLLYRPGHYDVLYKQ